MHLIKFVWLTNPEWQNCTHISEYRWIRVNAICTRLL